MKRLKTTALVVCGGLLAAMLFIPVMLILGGDFRVVASILIGPAEFLKNHVLPDGTLVALFGNESQGAHHMLSAALVLAFWWVVFSLLSLLLVAAVRRRRASPS